MVDELEKFDMPPNFSERFFVSEGTSLIMVSH
jgi:hypothetical protein